MHISKKLIAVAVVVAAIVAGATAYAAIPDGGGGIHGCYDKNSGQLRVTDTDTNTPKSCTSKETALAWNQEGPQGAKGDPGPQGPKGDTGLTGISGLHQLVEAAPAWNTSGLHTVYKTCPVGERALGGGYDVYESNYQDSTIGSAAAKVEEFGTFNPPNGTSFGQLAVTVDASKLPPLKYIVAYLYLTCAQVS